MPKWMYNCAESNDEAKKKDKDEQSTVNDDDAMQVSNANLDMNVDVATEVDIAQNLEMDDILIDEAILDIMSSTILEDETDEI